MNNPYFNLIAAVWKEGKPWRVSIIAIYFALAMAQIFLSLSPYAFGRCIDLIQSFKPEHLSAILFWLIFEVLMVPLFWLFHGPARVVERKIALKIQQSLRMRIYTHLTQLPLKWHQDNHSGSIISRIERAALALYSFAENQFVYIQTIIKFLMSIGFLLMISPLIGFISLVACAIASAIILAFDRRLIPMYIAENEINNRVAAIFFDYISSMTTVLTLRLGPLTQSNLWKKILTIWPIFNREVVINEVKWFTMGLCLSVFQSIILISYIFYYLKTFNGILIGTVVMIFRYQYDLSEVFFELSAHYSDLVRKDADIAGLEPILKNMNEPGLISMPPKKSMNSWQNIQIRSLNFYHGADDQEKTIHDLCFDLNKGEKIALIGTSGAGKSSLLNLLSGLYQPQEVELKIDDLHFNSLEELQNMTTLIPQEPELFENTIAFNINLGLESDDETLAKVIDLAGFSKVLARLPAGLATDIREKGLNLSVGQKQRLALARGLFAARFSSLILMDEPTSSIDLATERKILSHVIDHFTEATMIISIHRLHLLPKFDRIIMLDQGKIIADGATKKLLQEAGPVFDLWHEYQNKH